jgi:hypothetical protein
VSRLPSLAFTALVLATVAAFFITQHLKVATPLLAGFPAPDPAAINPVSGRTCDGRQHRRMLLSFYLLHQSDYVDVTIVDARGRSVDTIASHRYMPGGARRKRSLFTWDGRESDGRVAPDGLYYIRVHLIGQDRTVTIAGNAGAEPVRVETHPPKPLVTAVTPARVSSLGERVTITLRGSEGRLVDVRLFRLHRSGERLVKSFIAAGTRAIWDLRIQGRPAPAGTYLVGLQVTDAACNVGTYTPPLPPVAGDSVTVSPAVAGA